MFVWLEMESLLLLFLVRSRQSLQETTDIIEGKEKIVGQKEGPNCTILVAPSAKQRKKKEAAEAEISTTKRIQLNMTNPPWCRRHKSFEKGSCQMFTCRGPCLSYSLPY